MLRDWFARYCSRIWTTDLRSLALVRILVGLVVLLDVLVRIPDLEAHYSDVGIFPRAESLKYTYKPVLFSLHLLSVHLVDGSVAFNAILFAFQAIIAVMLIVGYKTRLVTFLTWFLLDSLFLRVLILENLDFQHLRIVLLWMCFLPLGARFSVDSYINRDQPAKDNAYSSWAVVGLMLHICWVYLCTFLLKTGPEWRDGTALYLSLDSTQYHMPAGLWLLAYPKFLEQITYLVLFVEFLIPVAFLCPFKTSFLRFCTLSGIIVMHTAIALTLASLWLFSLTFIAPVFIFLPGIFWDKLGADVRIPDFAARIMPRRWENVFAVLFLSYSCWIGWHSFHNDGTKPFLGMREYWPMFASSPVPSSNWVVMPSRLSDGRTIDLFRDYRNFSETEPVRWIQPDWTPLYISPHWHTAFSSISISKLSKYDKRQLPRYFCQAWNTRHSGAEHMEHIQIYRMAKMNRKIDKRAPYSKILIAESACAP